MEINYEFMNDLAKAMSETLNRDVTLPEGETTILLPADVNILKIPIFVFLKLMEEGFDEYEALEKLDNLNILEDYQGTGKIAIYMDKE